MSPLTYPPSLPLPLTRLVNLSFKVDDFGRIKTNINFWEDLLQESSYVIEPRESLIQPYGTQTFKVTLNKTGMLLFFVLSYLLSFLIYDFFVCPLQLSLPHYSSF